MPIIHRKGQIAGRAQHCADGVRLRPFGGQTGIALAGFTDVVAGCGIGRVARVRRAERGICGVGANRLFADIACGRIAIELAERRDVETLAIGTAQLELLDRLERRFELGRKRVLAAGIMVVPAIGLDLEAFQDRHGDFVKARIDVARTDHRHRIQRIGAIIGVGIAKLDRRFVDRFKAVFGAHRNVQITARELDEIVVQRAQELGLARTGHVVHGRRDLVARALRIGPRVGEIVGALRHCIEQILRVDIVQIRQAQVDPRGGALDIIEPVAGERAADAARNAIGLGIGQGLRRTIIQPRQLRRLTRGGKRIVGVQPGARAAGGASRGRIAVAIDAADPARADIRRQDDVVDVIDAVGDRVDIAGIGNRAGLRKRLGFGIVDHHIGLRIAKISGQTRIGTDADDLRRIHVVLLCAVLLTDHAAGRHARRGARGLLRGIQLGGGQAIAAGRRVEQLELAGAHAVDRIPRPRIGHGGGLKAQIAAIGLDAVGGEIGHAIAHAVADMAQVR